MKTGHVSPELDLNLLVVLDALLEHGSTVEAARRLGRTQSAVSHALRRLRERFGDPLFVRVGRALAPTARAEALRAPLRAVLEGAAALHGASAPLDPASLERVFRLVVTDWAEHVLLPPLLARLAREAPGVALELSFVGDVVEDVIQRGRADLALGTGFRELDGVMAQALFEERFVCVCRHDPPRVGRRLTRARYLAERHVVVAPRGLPGSRVDDRLAPSERRRVVLRTPHFATAAAVVARTELLVTLPETFARAVAPSLRLDLHALPIELPRFAMQQIFPATLRHDPAHAWLRQRIFEVAAELRSVKRTR